MIIDVGPFHYCNAQEPKSPSDSISEQFATPDVQKLSNFNSTSVSTAVTRALLTFSRTMEYHVIINEQQAGPYTIDQLRSMWASGSIKLNTLFWAVGMADWQPILTIIATLQASMPRPIASPTPSSYEPLITATQPASKSGESSSDASTVERKNIFLTERPLTADGKTPSSDYERANAQREECVLLTLGPGIVRYLRGCDLCRDNYKKLIDEIEKLGFPLFEFPYKLPLIGTKGPDDSWDDYKKCRIDFGDFWIFDRTDYKKTLEQLIFIAEEYRASPFSEKAYRAFSEHLGLEKLALKEFRESCIHVARDGVYIPNDEIINSYRGSDDHEILVGYLHGAVFLKTQFWIDSKRNLDNFLEQEKQREIAEIEQEKQEAVERVLAASQMEADQKLIESGYMVYVYVMEDTRNGLFKIGKSNNPLKRERTLQSEAPTTQLRFALPCAESVEAELHQRYASTRMRGEWFALDSSMLFELVTDLISRGDATRLHGEQEWLGEVLVRRFCKT